MVENSCREIWNFGAKNFFSRKNAKTLQLQSQQEGWLVVWAYGLFFGMYVMPKNMSTP